MRYEHAKSMTFSLLKKIYIGSKCLFFLFAVYCLLVFLGIGVSVNWLSSTLFRSLYFFFMSYRVMMLFFAM
jgi:hypothetical protein